MPRLHDLVLRIERLRKEHRGPGEAETQLQTKTAANIRREKDRLQRQRIFREVRPEKKAGHAAEVAVANVQAANGR